MQRSPSDSSVERMMRGLVPRDFTWPWGCRRVDAPSSA
ncbi:MAG: hypothetical protein AVDCRST_MAG15-2804 [uncultured Rubellimicrobium sp.]|uniref:Uncharacterized protein n=1 Tax=uncultured Rubellimicrobium sp. TaxID=543078 RepID=A0A6J4PZ61_9RHOB|nr:MAG: hypothetical protein AVDCRST_MAG15-2804 [uncultured Rubellimicrobium sp.]